MFDEQVRKRLHCAGTESERHYIQQRIQMQEQGMTHIWAILDILDNKRLIGAVEIRNESYQPNQLYVWISSLYWSKGYGSYAVRLASAYYFKITQQLYITACVERNNKASMHALKKAGFAHVGLKEGAYGSQYILLLRARKP
jgi:RimJ/RimL family protein N-acetyltransferase